jgi:hypothetical protein
MAEYLPDERGAVEGERTATGTAGEGLFRPSSNVQAFGRLPGYRRTMAARSSSAMTGP